MKARLIRNNNMLQLLICNGIIKVVDYLEAKHFFLHYDDPSFYSEPGKWDYESVSMEEYKGETIAIVNDEGELLIKNSRLFRNILSLEEVKYITVPEYAAKHGKKNSIIRRFCLDGRLSGAIQKGSRWLIPENCPYPISEK